MAADVASYIPSQAYTETFWDKERTRTNSNEALPLGFPKQIDSSLVWTGAELTGKDEIWTLNLDATAVAAIDTALANFEASHIDLSKLSQETFKLPASLSARLKQVSDHLYNGIGFHIIRGLDPSRYTAKQCIIIYAGVSAHVCPERGFTDVKAQSVITHIVNVQSGDKGPETVAPAFTNSSLSFHTDNCEIMAFFYLEPAARGGQTLLSSLWQTYNELAATRPDSVHELAKQWVFDSFKPHDLQKPRYVRPLQPLNSKVPILFRFSRYGMLGWQRKRNPGLPTTTQAQVDAADAIQFICMKNSLQLQTKKGDLLLVNDMAVIHSREAFQDDDDAISKRHLVKMHVRDPEKGWSIPAEMENEWKIVYSSNRDDHDRKEVWDIYHEAGMEELSSVNG